MKKYTWLLPLLLLSQIGCSTALPVNQDNGGESNVESKVVTASEMIDSYHFDTTNWQHYGSGKYRFHIKVSDLYDLQSETLQGATYSDPQDNTIQITIVDYSDAINLPQGGDNIALTQQNLDEIRTSIEEDISTIEVQGKKVKISHGYDVPSGAFYEQAQFFLKQDLVTITISLPIADQPIAWSNEKREFVQDESDKIDHGLAAGEVYHQISLLNAMLRTLELKEEPSLGMLSSQNGCFTFLNNHYFVAPRDSMIIRNTNVLEALSNDWAWGNICRSYDREGIYIVAVSFEGDDTLVGEDLINRTTDVYPNLLNSRARQAGYNDYTKYQYYLFADYDLSLSIDNLETVLSAGELRPITELSWIDALAGCYIEGGHYLSDGLIIACGEGDNGCADIERVKWNVLTGESEYLNLCSNNCDLPEGEIIQLTCSSN